ncbi:MAG: aspartate aminotransferase family protein [Myxococcales bacterium]|nr:aspartate aminotransferase family protein [Myxococcales bacterium]
MLPDVHTPVPGPVSRAWVDRLAQRECPGITARRARRAASIGAADFDPIVWAEASGVNVWDVDGNRFVDLCAGFGVASVGHRHPAVVAAGQRQLAILPHAMGDAFPDPRRIELMERLCGISGLDRVIFGSSGSDAVEAAFKTALLATGRRRILTFEGGYHGLAAAPLAAIGYHVDAFQRPFSPLLGDFADCAPYGGPLPDLSAYAAVLVEPLQGRGGMRAPPVGWLRALHHAAHAAGALVIHDEIYSGFGRTGTLFASNNAADPCPAPDLLCVGKGLAGGFPLSACLGRAAAMDAWGASQGEAIHTQTFLGNPTGCAMALAALDVLEGEHLTTRAAVAGRRLATALAALPGVQQVTGRGLMLGVHMKGTLGVTRRLLERGWIVLPCGERAEALGITPPLGIGDETLDAFVLTLAEVQAAEGA